MEGGIHFEFQGILLPSLPVFSSQDKTQQMKNANKQTKTHKTACTFDNTEHRLTV